MIEPCAPDRATEALAPSPPQRPPNLVAKVDNDRESAPAGFSPGRPPAGGWDPWFLEHDRDLLALARHAGATGVEVDDAAQEARLACLTGLGRYGGDREGLRAWLAVVVRNRLANLGRRAATHPSWPLGPEATAMVSPEEDPAAAHDRGRLIAGVRAALVEARGRFPESSYLAVVLRCSEGRTTAEVAATLGLPEDQVRDRYRWALPRFRALLARRLGPGLMEIAGVGWVPDEPIASEVMP